MRSCFHQYLLKAAPQLKNHWKLREREGRKVAASDLLLLCRKLKVGDTAHLAEMRGWDTPLPKDQLDQLRDIDGGTIKRITRNFVWVALDDGRISRVARKWVCTYIMIGHQAVPCPLCGYGLN